MAPTGKTKKSSKKSRLNKLDAATEASAILLAMVKQAADFAPIPYLKIAAGTTLSIVNTVQAVKDNKAEFQRLAQDCIEIMAVAWKSYKRVGDPDKWPKDTAEMVEGLVTTLITILGFVEGQADRGRAMRVIYSVADIAKIKEYRERLQTAISRFEVSSHLSIQDTLHQVLKRQDDLSAQLESQGLTPVDTVLLRQLDEKARAQAKEEAEEKAAKERIEEMEKLKTERDSALKEMIRLQEAREDVDKTRIEQEKMAATLKRWKEKEEEEAELGKLKEAQRLREEKHLKEEEERRAKLARALIEEDEGSEEDPTQAEYERLRQEEEDKKKRREEKAAALRKRIEQHRVQESVTISAKVKMTKPPAVEISSEEEEDSEEDSEEEEESEDEATMLARLEAERKARKAAKKKAARAQTTAEDTMRAEFERMGLGAGRTASPSHAPPQHSYAAPLYSGPYPYTGGHSPYYGFPYTSPVYGQSPTPPTMGGVYPGAGMFSPPLVSNHNSGNVTNMNMENMNNDNSIRYGGRRPKKAATTR